MRISLKILLQSLLFLGVLNSPIYASTCECEAISDEEAIAQADLVFRGRVVSIETNWMSGGWKFTFLVSETWKQESGQAYVVNSPWEKDCGYLFKQGSEYLVFVNRKFTPKTNACMGNRHVKEADDLIKILGPGKPIRPQSPQAGMFNWIITGLAVMGLLFMAMVVLRGKFRKN